MKPGNQSEPFHVQITLSEAQTVFDPQFHTDSVVGWLVGLHGWPTTTFGCIGYSDWETLGASKTYVCYVGGRPNSRSVIIKSRGDRKEKQSCGEQRERNGFGHPVILSPMVAHAIWPRNVCH